MKRYFYLTAAVAGLLMAASCQKEDLGAAEGDYAEVSFVADLPGGVATRAIADGQTVNKLYYEVYAVDADNKPVGEPVYDDVVDVTAGAATVNVRLIKNKPYTVFFWAQYNDTYDASDLKSVKISYDGAKANDDTRDAFYAVLKGHKYTGAAAETVELKRPFAQVNVGTSDLDEFKELGGTLETSKISFTDLATDFALFDASATDPTNSALSVTFGPAEIPSEKLKGVKDKDYDYLAMAYVLVPFEPSAAATSTTNISVEVVEVDGTKVDIGYEGATVQRNHRTNLVGAFLTSTADYDVVVDENFDDDTDYDDTDINNVLQNGGTFNLTENVTTDEPLVVAAGKSVVLNLAGNTYNYTGSGSTMFVLEEGAKFEIVSERAVKSGTATTGTTIKTSADIIRAARDAEITIGEGVNLVSTENCCVFVPKDAENVTINTAGNMTANGAFAPLYVNGLVNSGKINITGGRITHESVAIYIAGNMDVTISGDVVVEGGTAIEQRAGTLTVNGGTFTATANEFKEEDNDNGSTSEGAAIAICKHDTNHNLVAVINGGTFVGKKNVHVNNYSSTNEVSLVVNGGTFNDASAFAYLAEGAAIALGGDVTVEPDTNIPADVTIDGNNHEVSTDCEVTAGVGKGVFTLAGGTVKNMVFNSPNTQYDIIVKAGGSAVEDCEFPTATDEAMEKGKRAIYTHTDALTGTLTVKDCEFDDKVYAFNFSSANNQMEITFENCTLGGWLSGHGASHTFTGCTFTSSGEYKNYIPYCAATFSGCSFLDDFTISLKHASTLVIDSNCKVKDTTLTSPAQLKWDFSGDGSDNGTDETLTIGETTWTNSDTGSVNWIAK